MTGGVRSRRSGFTKGLLRNPVRDEDEREARGQGGRRKTPEAWLDATLRTLCADNTAIGLRSRPQ